MMNDSRDSQTMISTLFTMSALGVGLMTFLYNRIQTMIHEVKEDIRATQDGLHDLNENVNDMYLRIEALPTKEELGESSQMSLENEVEEKKYQAWIGTSNFDNMSLWVCIVRNKLSIPRENTEWMEWDGTKDASVIVRDYYFDTFESEDWKVTEENGVASASTYETMIDGWSNVIRVYMRVSFTDSAEAKPIEAYKMVLSKIREEGEVDWRRELTLSA